MYLDVVKNNEDEIVFNGTPADTVDFLLTEKENGKNSFWIIRGATLQGYTVEDYLLWMGV